MITITICYNNETRDMQIDPNQKIVNVLKVLETIGLIQADDVLEVLTASGRRVNRFLTFQEAQIYSGEKLIVR